jgi:hypothetical protein
MKHTKIYLLAPFAALLIISSIVSCEKDAQDDNRIETQINSLNPQAASEIKQAKAATSKYQNIQTAYADGYADISVIKPNMGYHFMRAEITDSVFEFAKPELLVYNRKADSSFQLVAIEYAVPFDLSENAPAGFTGNDDVWTHSDEFGLWLLHAWVYSYNPDGIFQPMNPEILVK